MTQAELDAMTPAERRALLATLRAADAARKPSLLAKARTFVRSATRHVLAGRPQTDPATKATRLALCLACEHRDPASGECNKCGCPTAKKTSWALETCPAGTW